MFLACVAPAATQASSRGSLEWFGNGCGPAGSVPEIGASGTTLAPGDAEFEVWVGKAPGGWHVLHIGVSNAWWGGIKLPFWPYGPDGSGCNILVSQDLQQEYFGGGAERHVPMPIPRNMAFAGSDVYFQWEVWQPVGPMLPAYFLTMSRGLHLRIGS